MMKNNLRWFIGLLLILMAGCTATPIAAPTPTPVPPPVTSVPSAAPVPTVKISTPAVVFPTPTPTPAPATSTATIPAATAMPSPTEMPPLPVLALTKVATGLTQPTYITVAPGDDSKLFVVERLGTVRVLQNGQLQPHPFLDITSLVEAGGQEQGLLSIAFHPQFPADPRVFVNYTGHNNATIIAAYRLAANEPSLNPASAQILMTFRQPYRNHNGGQLQFGPDGNLYIGTGDGGSANDPRGNGQNLSSLLGKLLRISVDFGEPYTVPADNPFVGTPNARPEVWAYGLRNPWRFSFDRETGDLWIADVGQNKFEEIDFLPLVQSAGANFGWNVMEGLHCFQKDTCQTTGLVLPVAEYSHDDGCSVTGGYIYRGTKYPGLSGMYLYGDFCSGKIWGMRIDGLPAELLDTRLNISSFGEDAAGELYVLDLNGSIFQVTSNE